MTRSGADEEVVVLRLLRGLLRLLKHKQCGEGAAEVCASE